MLAIYKIKEGHGRYKMLKSNNHELLLGDFEIGCDVHRSSVILKQIMVDCMNNLLQTIVYFEKIAEGKGLD